MTRRWLIFAGVFWLLVLFQHFLFLQTFRPIPLAAMFLVFIMVVERVDSRAILFGTLHAFFAELVGGMPLGSFVLPLVLSGAVLAGVGSFVQFPSLQQIRQSSSALAGVLVLTGVGFFLLRMISFLTDKI